MDKKTQALVEQYARSLVEVAFEQDAVSTIQEEVRQILTVFSETNLKNFLSQENVTSEAKKESLSLFQESCSVYMNNFLEVILLNDRANILYDVLKLVLELFDQEDNTYDVTVTSASPLSEEQKARLLAIVSQKFEIKTRRLVEKIDEDLIGRFVIKAFQNYLTEKNIPIYTSSPVDELIVDNKGSVVGVRGRSKNGEKFEVKAKAVVLATGGFPHNEEMLKRLVPAYAKYAKVSVASVGNTGDGINMAKRIGASEYKDAWVIGLYAGAQKKELNATFSTKNKYKDSVFVNDEGKRFVKEDLPYLTDAIAHQKAAWAITDSTDPKKVEVLKQYNDPNIAVHGSTWQELAKAMGVSTENLVTTMTAYNEACRTGDDKLFNKPKEHLLPFLNPPYFAVRVVPQTGGTIGGIKTNDKFQVLRDDNTVIKGLYAGGEVTNRPYYNRVYTSGSGLGIAYTSGRIAGTNAAKEK